MNKEADRTWSSSDIRQLETLASKIPVRSDDESLHRDFDRLLHKNSRNTHPFFLSFQPVFCRALETLYRGDFIDYSRLSFFSAGQLKLKYRLDSTAEPDTEQLYLMAQDHLFLSCLEKGINIDYEFERYLEKLRGFLLIQFSGHPVRRDFPLPFTRLAAALAQQCFNNEYIFTAETEEETFIAKLGNELVEMFRQNDLPFNTLEVYIPLFTMYRPLYCLPEAVRLTRSPLETFSKASRACIRQTLFEPLEEMKLKKDIPSFGRIADPVSQTVRRQYEAHPYPRWFHIVKKTAKPLPARFAERFSHGSFFFNPSTSQPSGPRPLRLLVPGCGTGRHPLWLAAGNPRAEVVAIDLSKESLAYGKRMAAKLKIRNVEFLHGDLLELPQTGQTFHHVDCTGVLHHLEEPEAGWAALDQVTLPGGTLRIAVYSSVARMIITFIRKEIQRLNLEPEPAVMKQFRHTIMTHKKYRAFRDSLAASQDFFATGSLRDLLFHAREFRYTLDTLKQTIEKFNLIFLGFRLNDARMKAVYLERFPDDPRMNNFEYWRQFEKAYTGTMNMFDFWVQKPHEVE